MKKEEQDLLLKDLQGWGFRTAPSNVNTFKREGKTATVEAVVTTEQPAVMIDWEKSDFWSGKIVYMREILLMSGATVPSTKQVPLLNTHSRWDTSDVRGSIRNLRVENDKMVGDVNFWSKAEDEMSQVEEGHLTDLSAGYKISETDTVIIDPGKSEKVNGKTFENNYGDNYRLFIRTKWALKEGSLVPIGADDLAKFRSELQPVPAIKADDPDLQKKLNEAIDEIKQLKQTINLKETKMEKEKNAPEKSEEQIRKEERERVAGIKAVAESLVVKKLYKGGQAELDKATVTAIDNGTSRGAFQEHCYNNLKNEDIVETPITDLDMSPKEYNGLSIGRAVEAMLKVREGDTSAWDKLKAGKEKEAIDETRKRVENLPGVELRGFPIPMDFFKNKDVMKHSNVLKAAHRNAIKNGEFPLGQRASDGVSASDATYLIGTENMFNEFIDVLRNLGVAGPWGARMISGAKQNISVPKKTSTGTYHWVAESGTGTATDFVIGQLTATPHNGWASMKRTRQAAYQSVPALDALIIDDIMNNTIIGRDLALLHGTGSSNQPTGVDHTSGIGDVVGASLDWEAVVEFWTDVKTNNINSANLRFVMNALTAGKLMTRSVVSGQTQMLYDRLGQLSAPPIISEQVAANNLFYGDGSEAWMIDWGVIDLLVNPYKDDTGDVVFTVFSAMDVLVSRANAFSLADDVS